MIIENLYKKPFKLLSVVGCVYLLISIILNLITGFSYKNSIYPFSNIATFVIEGVVFVLFVLSFFFYNKHLIFYTGLELLVFGNIYISNIYIALFLSSIFLVLILTENKTITIKHISIYTIIEIVKLALVIPYGVGEFFRYVGLSLFALCAIGCINLLFHHAYNKNGNTEINLDDYKFSDRQKDCIKEIVVNNTTIKALAINHNISESAIKKDLAHIYNSLGITGKADLKALFIGYNFENQ